METFMAPSVNPPADGIGLDGLARGWSHIEQATRNGADRDARWNMMSASVQGALAFQKGLGCVHSLSHSLGGVNPRLHHGTLNAIFLPAVIRFNAPAESMQKDKRLQRMAHAMGLRSCDAKGSKRWAWEPICTKKLSTARWQTIAIKPTHVWRRVRIT
jgi:alcohol dehydrogenase class IV